jgi:hypothetical protein
MVHRTGAHKAHVVLDVTVGRSAFFVAIVTIAINNQPSQRQLETSHGKRKRFSE